VLVGGSDQLASQLREGAKSDPDRFLGLGTGPEVGSDPAYVDAILHGLRETQNPVTPALLFAFVRHVFALDTNHDRWIGDALRPVYDIEIPLDIVEALIDRARSSNDPLPGAKPIITSTSRDEDDDDHPLTDPFTDGMNRARGSLVLALAALLLHDTDGSRSALVTKHLNHFARDPSASVRACVAHLISASLRHAESAAIHAYPIAADGQDEALATRPFEQLTVYVAYRDSQASLAVIDTMLESKTERVRRSGARLGAFLALEFNRPELLARLVSSSDAHARRGAAVMCAHRLRLTALTGDATAALRTLLVDADSTVRESAAEVAGDLRGERLRPHAPLLIDLIRSDAFSFAVPQLLITLEQAPDQIGDLILATAERLILTHRDELSDMRTHAAADAHSMSTLVVRAYAQATSDAARSTALDLIDDLLRLGAYGVEDALRESER
jgi:hypothetical protein